MAKSIKKQTKENEEVLVAQEEVVETDALEEVTIDPTSLEVEEEVEIEHIEDNSIEIQPLDETQPLPTKKVRIVTNRDHRCNVGGEWYTFKQGVQQNVPENVKKILASAGLLSVL